MRRLLLVMALAAAPAAAAQDGGLDWLAGHWCGGSGDRQLEEAWLPEAGGELLGMARTVEAGEVRSFEFMRIVADGAGASFHAQPGGAPATGFEAEARGDGWIRFVNEAHDFPNRVEYRRDGERLLAWISGPHPDGGEAPLRIAFEYDRCPAPGR